MPGPFWFVIKQLMFAQNFFVFQELFLQLLRLYNGAARKRCGGYYEIKSKSKGDSN